MIDITSMLTGECRITQYWQVNIDSGAALGYVSRPKSPHGANRPQGVNTNTGIVKGVNLKKNAIRFYPQPKWVCGYVVVSFSACLSVLNLDVAVLQSTPVHVPILICAHMWTPWHGSVPIECGKALIARLMGPTWGPSGADKTQVGPMLVPWTLLSEYTSCGTVLWL